MMSNIDSQGGEERIRRDYEKGLTYRELAKKHRKSFTQLQRILGTSKEVTIGDHEKRLRRVEYLVDDEYNGEEKAYQDKMASVRLLDIWFGSLEGRIMNLEASAFYSAFERFRCEVCGTKHQVALSLKCTRCGSLSHWGNWPKENHASGNQLTSAGVG